MDEVWGNVYCGNVTCDSPKKRLEPMEKFAEKYRQECSKGILKKLRELVDDPMTRDSTPWIDKLLHQVFGEVGSRGFKVKDLPDIVQILEFLGWKAREIPEYQKHLRKMLEIIGRPPELEKSSEILTCSDILKHYFTHLGCLILLLPNHAEIVKILGSLHELLTRPEKSHVSAIKLEYLHKAMENSNLPVILARLIDICPPQISKNLLEVVCDLVIISEICCHKMLEEDILSSLLPQLEHTYQKFDKKKIKDELILTIRVFWMLMRSAQPSETLPSVLKNVHSPNDQLTRYLKNIFMTIVHESSSESHLKKIRNDLAMIILAGLIAMPSWNLVSCGLATDIIILSKSSQIPVTQDDLFFLKALLAVLCHFAASHFCISMMKENQVISGILRFLCIDEESKMPKSTSHCSYLAAYVLRTLTTLVPELWEDFVKFQGPMKLLITLEWSITMDSNPLIILESIKTICSIISTQHPDVLSQFKTAGIINLLFKLINRILILNELTLHNQTVLTLLLITLESLLQNDISSQLNYGDQGLKVTLKFLHRFTQETEKDFSINDKLVISIASYTWNCIVHCPSILKKLIEHGGIYLILDSLEKSSLLSQNVFLGILSDMCTESHCIAHLCTWRGLDKSKGLLSLLGKIWRDEEQKIGVKRTSNGCIEDIELPLMGKMQWRNSFYTKTIENYSPTLESLLGSVRPKIYSIRQQLLAKSEVFEKAREHFKILMDDLPLEDSITFCVIDQFFRFTRGQVWGEVLRYLKQKGVNPLGADGEMLLVICQRHRECGLYVRDCQERIILEEREKERRREMEEIERIRDARLVYALKAARTINLIERTADRDYRARRRNEQKVMVDEGLRFPEGVEPGDCHRTYPEKWNVTVGSFFFRGDDECVVDCTVYLVNEGFYETILNQNHRIKATRSCSDSEEVRIVSPASSTTISYNYSEDWDY